MSELKGVLSRARDFKGSVSQEVLVLIGKAIVEEVIEARGDCESLPARLLTFVEKVEGKQLTTNDFTTYLKGELQNLIANQGNVVNKDLLNNSLANYVLLSSFKSLFDENYAVSHVIRDVDLGSDVSLPTEDLLSNLSQNSLPQSIYCFNIYANDLPNSNLNGEKCFCFRTSQSTFMLLPTKGHLYYYNNLWVDLFQYSTATQSSEGLMSAQDKKNLDTVMTLFEEDSDDIVNTIAEVLKVFSTYPEGVDISRALSSKVDIDTFDAKMLEIDVQNEEIKSMLVNAQNLINEINGEVI